MLLGACILWLNTSVLRGDLLMSCIPGMSNDCTLSRQKVSPLVYHTMYSLIAVGGIQYTTEMAKTSKNNNNKTKRVVVNHAFKNCRDALTVPSGGSATPSQTVFTAASDTTGAGRIGWILAPIGLTATTSDGTGIVKNGPPCNLLTPPLRGLFSKAVDFQWYRITRAKLIFVSNQGSTIAGQITLSAYTDPSDVAVGTYGAQLSSVSTKTFDLASAVSKEITIPIPVDSAWKRSSSILSVVGNSFPYQASGPNTSVIINTVADLVCGAIGVSWYGVSLNGTAAVTNLGVFYVDYDAEFKGPIDQFVNN